MVERSYNIGTFVKNLREKGIGSAWNKDWSETLNRGYLTKTGNIVLNAAAMGILIHTVNSGIEAFVTPQTIFQTIPKLDPAEVGLMSLPVYLSAKLAYDGDPILYFFQTMPTYSSKG